jgi:hypothetical protein
MLPQDPKAAAATLDQIRKELKDARVALEAGLKAEKAEKEAKADPIVEKTKVEESKTEGQKAAAEESEAGEKKTAPITATRIAAYRAANRITELRKSLDDWYKHFDGYDSTVT